MSTRPLLPEAPALEALESHVRAPLSRRARNLRTTQLLTRRLDEKDVDGLDAFLAPAARIEEPTLMREPGEPDTWRSLEARIRSLDERNVAWTFRASRIAAATDEVFLVDAVTTRARYGGGFASALTLLVTFRGSLIATIDAFERRDQALQAAGLS